MFWNVWSSIGENAERNLFAEQPAEDEQFLEVCGLDCKDHLFIEKTAAILHHEGIRKFILTAAVEPDGIILIRPMHSMQKAEFKGRSTLFQICKVEEKGSMRIVHARLFEPLPNWPRYKHSYALK